MPGPLAAELRSALMTARRNVAAALRHSDISAEKLARRDVQNAKIALGERGRPWWEAPTAEDRQLRKAAISATLLLAQASKHQRKKPKEATKRQTYLPHPP